MELRLDSLLRAELEPEVAGGRNLGYDGVHDLVGEDRRPSRPGRERVDDAEAASAAASSHILLRAYVPDDVS